MPERMSAQLPAFDVDLSEIVFNQSPYGPGPEASAFVSVTD